MFGLDTDIREEINRVQSAWVLERKLAKLLSEGWILYYDEDGRYFRTPDPTGDLILIYKPA
jgi:hypothetical protein